MAGSLENCNLENGNNNKDISDFFLKEKADQNVVVCEKGRFKTVRGIWGSIRVVIFGTKLCVLFPAVPMAMMAQCYNVCRCSERESGVMAGPLVICNLENRNNNKDVSGFLLREKPDQNVVVCEEDLFKTVRGIWSNILVVIFGTKFCLLFPAVPMAILAQCYCVGRPWIFALSLLGLAPLAERVSFLTEQIAYYTGPTVGGLLNATCGNATELIIALFALRQRKIHVVKYSLFGSVLSNLLLVLGSSLLCGGLANINKEQKFDKKQSDMNMIMLLFGLLCLLLPLTFRYAVDTKSSTLVVANSILMLSRTSSILMLAAYFAYLFFQLRTHRQFLEAQEEEDVDTEEEKAVIGFWSAFIWLGGMTILIAVLSEYIVGTIEAASDSWGISVSFISVILLPIVGNAAEHAGSIIFAFKNKLNLVSFSIRLFTVQDISLGVALGSATQISIFVVPLCVIVAWIIGVQMDLDFNLLETCSLAFSIILTAFTLQDGTSHYLKGAILCFSYAVIAACFFVHKIALDQDSLINMDIKPLFGNFST